MSYQLHLDEYGFDDPLDHPQKKELPMGKIVRDANYHILWNDDERIHGQCRLVLTILLEHPEGLTDNQLSELTGLKRSTINGRRNDLIKKFNIPIFGDLKDYYPDENGHQILRTKWRIRKE